MILINDYEIHSEEDLKMFLDYMESLAITEPEKLYFDVLKEHMEEVYEQDKKLQKMVSEKISEDLTSVTTLPLENEDEVDVFHFGLIKKDNKKVKKREQIFFRKLCDECFGHVPGLYSRMVIRLSEE